jgi:hypothetical protein
MLHNLPSAKLWKTSDLFVIIQCINIVFITRVSKDTLTSADKHRSYSEAEQKDEIIGLWYLFNDNFINCKVMMLNNRIFMNDKLGK